MISSKLFDTSEGLRRARKSAQSINLGQSQEAPARPMYPANETEPAATPTVAGPQEETALPTPPPRQNT